MPTTTHNETRFPEVYDVLTDKKKVLHGDVFIVPNSLIRCGDISNDEPIRRAFGVMPWDLCAQVWMVNEECENWDCHGYPVNLFAIPTNRLLGLREGQLLKFDYTITSGYGEGRLEEKYEGKVIEVCLRLRQGKYRYSDYADGTFEGVLSALIQSARNDFERSITGD